MWKVWGWDGQLAGKLYGIVISNLQTFQSTTKIGLLEGYIVPEWL
jgi:hypothetical protein